jgi:hypothetical protein
LDRFGVTCEVKKMLYLISCAKVILTLKNKNLLIICKLKFYFFNRKIVYESERECVFSSLAVEYHVYVTNVWIRTQSLPGRLHSMCGVCDGTEPSIFREILGPLNFEVLIY